MFAVYAVGHHIFFISAVFEKWFETDTTLLCKCQMTIGQNIKISTTTENLRVPPFNQKPVGNNGRFGLRANCSPLSSKLSWTFVLHYQWRGEMCIFFFFFSAWIVHKDPHLVTMGTFSQCSLDGFFFFSFSSYWFSYLLVFISNLAYPSMLYTIENAATFLSLEANSFIRFHFNLVYIAFHKA